MPIKIYKFEASPPYRAVKMIAEILKVEYETHEMNFLIGQNRKPEYLEKNPQHSVPLLEDGDFLLPDSHAIITYLVSKYGGEKRSTLYPNDLKVRALVDSRMYLNSSILFIAARRVTESILRYGMKTLSPQHIEDINDAYVILDKYLQKTKFVACEHLTIADVACVATMSSLNVLVPMDDKFVHLKAWLSSLQEEDWYQKANLPGLADLKQVIKELLTDSV